MVAGGVSSQPWPESRCFHSALSLHDSDSNPLDPTLLVMWGASEGKVFSDVWVFLFRLQQWRKVRLCLHNTLLP